MLLNYPNLHDYISSNHHPTTLPISSRISEKYIKIPIRAKVLKIKIKCQKYIRKPKY